MQELQTVLLNVKTHKVAFTADIKKAFLQIELNIEDREATRLLWFKDINKSVNDPNNSTVYRFCRVLFGAAPSPYLHNSTVQHHLNQQGDWISENLQKSIYMDNVVTGTNTEQEALGYYFSSRNYFKQAGMIVHQWTTNSTILNDQTRNDEAKSEPTVKILGLAGMQKQIPYLVL